MKDENQELQKQIGCISGFFQLFDRHRFLTGHNNSHNMPNQGNLQYLCVILFLLRIFKNDFLLYSMYFVLSFKFSNHIKI